MIDAPTIVLMLLAGLLHASWHSLVKYGGDQILVLAGMGLVAAAAAACALPLLPLPAAPVWPVIAGSVVLHVGYKLALARSYTFGDLGQAYPMARGLVPLFSTAIAFAALSQAPSTIQMLGIALVSAGLIWLATHSIRGGVDRRLFLAAIAAGLTVAGYSVVDAYGTRRNGDWMSFTAWLIVCDALTFAALVSCFKGRRLWVELWRHRTRMLISGGLGLLSFSVFLWALSHSPVGAISALRESSVLFATVLGIVAYRERASAHKIAAAALIVTGLVVIATAR
jgi:drug/metabolite transporter (DMT)-like permease